MTAQPSSHSPDTAHYFGELEARIVQRLHAEAQSDQSRAELLRNTGIQDPELIEELSKMGITVHELITLRFIPLVLVAWAEGHADLGEREVVREQAKHWGICEDSTAWLILDTWLRKRPPGIGVDAWKRYTRGLIGKMSPNAARRLVQLTEKQMTAVAKASGGHLGFGKVSQKESTMISRLVKTMTEGIKD